MQIQEALDYYSTKCRNNETLGSLISKLTGRTSYLNQENTPVPENTSYLLIEAKEYSADSHLCLRRDVQRIISEYMQSKGLLTEEEAQEIRYKGAVFAIDTNITDNVLMGRRPDGTIVFEDLTTSTSHCTLSWNPQVLRAFSSHLDVECSQWNIIKDRNPSINYQQPTEEQIKPWKSRIFKLMDSSLNGTYVETREGIERIRKGDSKELSFSEEIIIGMPLQRDGVKTYIAKISLTLISPTSPILNLINSLQSIMDQLATMNDAASLRLPRSSLCLNPLERMSHRPSAESRVSMNQRRSYISPGGPYSVDGSSVDGRSLYRSSAVYAPQNIEKVGGYAPQNIEKGGAYAPQNMGSSAVARLTNSLQRLKDEKERVEKELNNSLHHLDSLEAEKRQLKGQLDEMRTHGNNQTKEFHVLATSLQNAQTEVHRYQKTLVEAQKSNESLQIALNDSKAIQVSQKESLSELRKSIEQKKTELQIAKQEAITAKNDLAKHERESSLLIQQEKQEKQDIIDELTDKVRTLTTTIKGLQKDIHHSEQNHHLKLESMELSLQTAEEEIQRLNDAIETSKSEYLKLKGTINELTTTTDSLEEAKNALASQKTKCAREIERNGILQDSNEDLLERLSKSEQIINNLEHKLGQWTICIGLFSDEINTFINERGTEILREMQNGDFGTAARVMPVNPYYTMDERSIRARTQSKPSRECSEDPPASNYVPPASNFVPPASNYVPPASNYVSNLNQDRDLPGEESDGGTVADYESVGTENVDEANGKEILQDDIDGINEERSSIYKDMNTEKKGLADTCRGSITGDILDTENNEKINKREYMEMMSTDIDHTLKNDDHKEPAIGTPNAGHTNPSTSEDSLEDKTVPCTKRTKIYKTPTGPSDSRESVKSDNMEENIKNNNETYECQNSDIDNNEKSPKIAASIITKEYSSESNISEKELPKNSDKSIVSDEEITQYHSKNMTPGDNTTPAINTSDTIIPNTSGEILPPLSSMPDDKESIVPERFDIATPRLDKKLRGSPMDDLPIVEDVPLNTENVHEQSIEKENTASENSKQILLNDVVANHRGWGNLDGDNIMGVRYSIDEEEIETTQ